MAQQAGRYGAKNVVDLIDANPGEPFHYFDKGIMAMIGRNAAIAEVGEHRHELTGAIAFAAWLGVHALLLTTTRAKIEAFIEWAGDYFGKVHGDPVLDRPGEVGINWSDGEKDERPQVREQGSASS